MEVTTCCVFDVEKKKVWIKIDDSEGFTIDDDFQSVV